MPTPRSLCFVKVFNSRELIWYLRGVARWGEILGFGAIQGRRGAVSYWDLDACWFAIGYTGGEVLCRIAVRFGEGWVKALAKWRQGL